MKNLLLKILVLLLVFQFSCTKDNLLDPERTDTKAITNWGYTNSPVSSVNGILTFDSYQDFKIVYSDLLYEYQDSIQHDSALILLGYDPTDTQNDQLEPEYPTLTLFEGSLDFSSLRAKEEAGFAMFLKKGNLPENYSEQDLISPDPILKTLLNEQGEVKISHFYFKFINDHEMIAISGNRYDLLEYVRNTLPNPIPLQENIRIYDTWNPTHSKSDLYSDATFSELISFCIASFTTTITEGFLINQVYIDVLSTSSIQGMPNEYLYSWQFEGNDFTTITTSGYGLNQISSVISVPSNAQSGPVIITLMLTGPSGCSETVTEIIPRNCNSSFTLGTGSYQNQLVLSVDNPGPIESIYTWDIDYEFGIDEQIVTSDPEIIYDYIYPEEGFSDITITLTVSNPIINCTSTSTQTAFTIGCGFDDMKSVETISFSTNSGDQWRLRGKIWVKNNFLTSSYGAFSKSYKKWLGIWIRKKCDRISVNLVGDVMNVFVFQGNILNCGVYQQPLISQSLSYKSKAEVMVTSNSNNQDIRAIPGELFASHHMLTDGTLVDINDHVLD